MGTARQWFRGWAWGWEAGARQPDLAQAPLRKLNLEDREPGSKSQATTATQTMPPSRPFKWSQRLWTL